MSGTEQSAINVIRGYPADASKQPVPAEVAGLFKNVQNHRDTVALLIADTLYSYTAGSKYYVAPGDIAEAGGFRYEVAVSGATDHHLTTAGGVKLYVANAGNGASVDALGAVGNNVTSDSAAFAIAASIGGVWNLRDGAQYLVANVALNVNSTSFACNGITTITKNANGSIFTGPADDLSFHGILFRGGPTSKSGLTGDTLSLTGNRINFIQCGSQWAAGRALKATGGPVNILAPAGIWQTDDVSATGWDIEIGKSGTATLYHQLHGVRSSQATGGILLIDTGSQAIVGGQFGKLKIQKGTGPSGVNGGMVSCCRILGNVDVEIASAVFTGNQFSTQTITFATGISGCSLDMSNYSSGATIVNNGSANNFIQVNSSTGSVTAFTYGAGSTKSFTIDNTTGDFTIPNELYLASNKTIRWLDSVGVLQAGMSLSSGDDWSFGSGNGAGFTNVNSGTGGIYFSVNNTAIAQIIADRIRPVADGVILLGQSTQQFSSLYISGGVYRSGVQVVSAQGAAVANATDASSVITQLNTLLSRLRAHGLIAT